MRPTALAWVALVATACSLCAKEVRRTMPLAANGLVTVDNHKGLIRVTGWDRAEVEFTARITLDSMMGGDQNLVDLTEIRVDAGPSSVRLQTDYKKAEEQRRGFLGLITDGGNLPRVEYEIRMPRGAALRIRDHRSDIEVSDLRSEVDVNTHRGRVQVLRHDGNVRVDTHRGEVTLSFLRLGGSSRVENYRGSTEILLPRSAGFNLDADVGRHGDLHSDFSVPTRRERHEQSARGSVNGGGPSLRVTSYRGSIRLRQV